MRKPIIAGNWKMNKTPDEAAAHISVSGYCAVLRMPEQSE